MPPESTIGLSSGVGHACHPTARRRRRANRRQNKPGLGDPGRTVPSDPLPPRGKTPLWAHSRRDRRRRCVGSAPTGVSNRKSSPRRRARCVRGRPGAYRSAPPRWPLSTHPGRSPTLVVYRLKDLSYRAGKRVLRVSKRSPGGSEHGLPARLVLRLLRVRPPAIDDLAAWCDTHGLSPTSCRPRRSARGTLRSLWTRPCIRTMPATSLRSFRSASSCPYRAPVSGDETDWSYCPMDRTRRKGYTGAITWKSIGPIRPLAPARSPAPGGLLYPGGPVLELG